MFYVLIIFRLVILILIAVLAYSETEMPFYFY